MQRKRLYHLIFILSLLSSPLAAQITKGTLLPGLDVTYDHSTQDYYNSNGSKQSGNYTTTGVSVTPAMGIFLSDRLVVGIQGYL